MDVNRQQRLADHADEIFKEGLKNLPTNEDAVYLQIKLRDCLLYIPSVKKDEKLQQFEKQKWQSVADYAKY